MADHYRDISAALSSALSTLATTLSITVAWENATFKPTNGVKYLRETLLPGDTEFQTLASSGEHLGIYQVDVIVPVDEGKSVAQGLADDIADAFDDTTLTHNGLDVEARSVSKGAGAVNGSWYILPVSIPYRSISGSR